MIHSIGLDLVEIARISSGMERYGERYVRRILGVDEILIFTKRYDKALFLAGRFAAKEAVIKGLGRFLETRPPLSEIQILNGATGQPQLHLPDYIQEKLKTSQCLLSITHEKNYAAAVAVFVEE